MRSTKGHPGARRLLKRFDPTLQGLPASARQRFHADNFVDLMGAGLAADLRRPVQQAAA